MDLTFLEDLLNHPIDDNLSKVLVVLAILVITWVVQWLLLALLPRITRAILSRTRTMLDDHIVRVIRPPLRFLISVIGLWAAYTVIEIGQPLDDIVDKFMGSLVAIAIFWAFLRAADDMINLIRLFGSRTVGHEATVMDEQLTLAVKQITKALIVIFAFATIMDQWGYNIGGLVAGLGIGGLAVALAAQDALSNLFGYFVILADEPFEIGEYIILGDVAGTVESLGFRSTRVRVLDQSIVSIPNKTVMNANITNWSRLSHRRLNMTLGITYSSSPDDVLRVVQGIREMLQEHELIQPDSVIVQFVEFNSSSLDLMIICFINTPAWADFQAAKQDINLKIMHILEENDVEVAFPTRTIWMEGLPQQDADQRPRRFVPPPKPEPTASTATDKPVPDDAAN